MARICSGNFSATSPRTKNVQWTLYLPSTLSNRSVSLGIRDGCSFHPAIPRWAKGSYQSSKSIDNALRTRAAGAVAGAGGAGALDVVMIEPGQVPLRWRNLSDPLRRIRRLVQDQRERLGRSEKSPLL